MRTEEFLDLYKQLETAIETRGLVDSSRYDNMVWGYMQTKAGSQHSDLLNACREIRNLLSHNPKLDGAPVVEPSDAVVAGLKSVISQVKNPLKALDFAVKGKNIYTARLNDSLLYVMKQMKARRYTHVPVIEGGRLYGVLSENSVFSYMLMHTLISIDDLTPVSELKRFLPIAAHDPERYEFVARKTLFYEIKERFESDYRTEHRLAAIFVTENGKSDEKIIGLITPWDILGKAMGR